MQQIVAQPSQRTGQSAGELFQRGFEFRGAGGVDHSQNGLGLGQVDASGEECAERELARLGRPRASGAGRPHDGLQKRRRTEGVNLSHRLACVTSPAGP